MSLSVLVSFKLLPPVVFPETMLALVLLAASLLLLMPVAEFRPFPPSFSTVLSLILSARLWWEYKSKRSAVIEF